MEISRSATGEIDTMIRCHRCEVKIITGNTCLLCDHEIKGKKYHMETMPLLALAFFAQGKVTIKGLDKVLSPNKKTNAYAKH